MAEALVPRAHTEDEEEAVRVLTVARLHDVARRRSCGIQEPLELHGVEDVGVFPVAVLGDVSWIEEVEARGDDNRSGLPDVLGDWLHIEVNTLGQTGLHASATREVVGRLVEASLDVYRVGARLRLLEGSEDTFPGPDPDVKLVR